MSKNLAENLFQNSILPLGARIEFYFQWSQWMNSINQYKQSSPNENNQQSNKTDNTISSGPQVQSRKATKILNLKEILNSNSYGTNLLEAFKQTGQMNENLRKLLCESILQFCIMHKHDLTTHDCSMLAKQISSSFPGEEMVHYIIFHFSLV